MNKKKDVYAKTITKSHRSVRNKDGIEFLLSYNVNFTNASDDNFSEPSEYLYEGIDNSSAYNDDSCFGLHRLDTDNTYVTDSYDQSYNLCSESCYPSQSSCQYQSETDTSTRSSYESILIIKTDSSLSLTTGSYMAEEDTISVISFVDSAFYSNASHYLISENDTYSVVSLNESGLITHTLDYDTSDTLKSNGGDGMWTNFTEYMNRRHKKRRNKYKERNNDVLIFRLSQTDVSKAESSDGVNRKDSVVVIHDINSGHKIIEVVNKLRKKFSEDSSVYLVVPTSDEDETQSSTDGADSTICIQISKNISKWDRRMIYCDAIGGIKFRSRGKRRHIFEKISNIFDEGEGLHSTEKQIKLEDISSSCKMKETITIKPVKELRTVSIDTIRDRPCCCTPKEQSREDIGDNMENGEFIPTVASELITPIIAKQGAAQGLHRDVYINCPRKSSKSLTSSQHRRFLSSQHTPVIMCRVPPCDATSSHSRAAKQQPNSPPSRLPNMQRNQSPKQSVRIESNQPVCVACRLPPCKAESGYASHIGIQTSGPPNLSLKPPKPALKQPVSNLMSCRVPPCRGDVCHQPIGTQVSFIPRGQDSTNNCKCDPEKIKEIFEKAVREMKSISCGDSIPKVNIKGTLPCYKDNVDGARAKGEKGSTCIPVPKRGNCSCDEKDEKRKKKKRKKQCPCERVNPQSKGCQCCICKGKSKEKCDCKGKKKNICECPPAHSPESEPIEIQSSPRELNIDHERLKYLREEFNRIDKAELKEELKMKSDMTQTTSGFRFKFKKRPLHSRRLAYMDSEEMSFEDALKYFEEHPEDTPNLEERPIAEIPPEDACKCDGPLPPLPPPPKKTDPECVCPPDEITGAEGKEGAALAGGAIGTGGVGAREAEEALKGFKLVIGGKGSGSKGLSGICCFDLLEIQGLPQILSE